MLTGPEFLTTFLYYFVCTALIVLLVISQGMEMSLDRSSYVIGMSAGLVAGLVGAYFNRSVTFSSSFKGNEKNFLKTFQKTLAEMGFEQNGQMEDFTIYTKSLFAGRVFVKTEKNTVTIVSRSSTVKRLQEELNLKSNNS
ncbi:hypothetical protein C7H19_20740 [Aphanothece hegewaldii CCALA 016]|uniref:Uncharacterized protein n=1 Tax=Aphanothece hegewaldii CCALA 016 TaxID=2107694 RepID=A0A2T1LSJ6_9CHRO|nr:hypothetical protein [Aphanothece hegewaldii]PSF33029.1 hypothetical protein C7H19_20740 [Aphanothece hegewaldii CCALA 016]